MSAKEMTDDVSCILRHREQLAWQKQPGKKRRAKKWGRKRHSGVEKKNRAVSGLIAQKNDVTSCFLKVNTNENQTKPKQPPKQNNLPNKTTTTKPQKQSERRNEMETDPCSSSNPMNELDYLHLPPMVPSSPL